MSITCTQNGEEKVKYEGVSNLTAAWGKRMVEFTFDLEPEHRVISVVLSDTACEAAKTGGQRSRSGAYSCNVNVTPVRCRMFFLSRSSP